MGKSSSKVVRRVQKSKDWSDRQRAKQDAGLSKALRGMEEREKRR